MENEARIGIGSTALFTLAGVWAPLLTWWVSGPLMVATGLVAIWGFVPAVQNIFTGNDDAAPSNDMRQVAAQGASPPPLTEAAKNGVPNWPIRNLFFHLKPDLQQTKKQADFDALAAEITDKLSTGQLLAWGRAIGRDRTLPLFPIPEDYWLHAKLNIWLLDDEPGGGNVLQARPDSTNAPNKTQYQEILINQAQALAEWPAPAPMTPRDIPLQEAAQIAYEQAERDGWLKKIGPARGSDPQLPLEYFKHAILKRAENREITLSGKEFLSRNPYPIPAEVVPGLWPMRGENTLHRGSVAGQAEFKDVTISAEDLDKVIVFYHALATGLRGASD